MAAEHWLCEVWFCAVHPELGVQCETARALRNVCTHADNRALVIAAGDPSRLVSLMVNSSQIQKSDQNLGQS